ncbi:MAG TPA: site-2 protease family protein [Vicinamibacterales bacterium]
MDATSLLYTISYAAIPVVFAITLHEVAHGFVARHFGDRTAEMLGRLSLNPIRHIDPIGTILVPAVMLALGGFLFGWAKPVPVDSRNMRNPRPNMVWVSAAGPAANIAMALVWAMLAAIVAHVDLGVAGVWVQKMAGVGLLINVLLAVFNMLPIPPLDGGQVLTNLLPRGGVSNALARVAPFGLFIVLFLIWQNLLTPIIGPPVRAILGLITSAFGL